MLSSPRYARTLLDGLEDDLFYRGHPEDRWSSHYLPRSSLRRHFDDFPRLEVSRHGPTEIAIPTTKGDKFTLNLDFSQFDPADISVKVEDDTVLVKGKKEKKATDGTTYECREYVQRFTVPKNVLSDKMSCNFDRSGYLRIEAPLKKVDFAEGANGRAIPVEIVHRTAIK